MVTEVFEERHPHRGDWLRDVVFGLNDGLVTTLVFVVAVSGVAHGNLVRIAFGELFAGGISMALGGFLAARTAQEVLARRIATERDEIRQEPEEERAELRAIYRAKGLRGSLLDRVVRQLTADDERWLQTMVRDELGVVENEGGRPWVQGVLVGVSFMVGALVPIFPFMLALPRPQWWAYGLTALTVLALGWLKARFTLKGPLRNSLELLAIVTVGTAGGVLIGLFLHTA